MIKFIANLLWLIFGGLIAALLWCLAGLILCITVIGIPLGVQCFKFAKISLAPFGKKVKLDFDKHPIANIVWLIFAGWEMALLYLFACLVCCITVVGIPLAVQAFKFSKLAIAPFGAKVSAKQ